MASSTFPRLRTRSAGSRHCWCTDGTELVQMGCFAVTRWRLASGHAGDQPRAARRVRRLGHPRRRVGGALHAWPAAGIGGGRRSRRQPRRAGVQRALPRRRDRPRRPPAGSRVGRPCGRGGPACRRLPPARGRARPGRGAASRRSTAGGGRQRDQSRREGGGRPAGRRARARARRRSCRTGRSDDRRRRGDRVGTADQPQQRDGRAARHARRGRARDSTEDHRVAHAAWWLPVRRRPRPGSGHRAEEARGASRQGAAVGAMAQHLRDSLAVALAEVRARPLHAAMAALVIGLLAGPRAPIALVGGLLVCPLVTRRTIAALAVAAALLGGAVVADARLAALDRTDLGERLGHATTARVWLLEPARPRPFGGRTAVVRLGHERVLVRTSARVPWPPAQVGQELSVDGVLDGLRPADAWLRPRNVHAVLRADRIGATGRSRRGLAGMLDGVRKRAEIVLARGLQAPEAALLRGMVLGEDEALSDRSREDFRTAGLSHLVAASGQNVMLLCALVFAVSALLGVGLRARLLIALGVIAVYVPLAGGGPSIQRAGVMGAAGVAATLAGRPASRWYALLLAA